MAVCFRLTGVPSRHVTHKLALSMAIDPDSLSHMIQGVSQYHDMNIHQHIPTLDHLSTFQHSLYTAADEVVANVSPYSKVDKTGPIGFAAGYIEQVIDFFRDVLGKAGIANGYGFSIIAFTLISKSTIFFIRLFNFLHINAFINMMLSVFLQIFLLFITFFISQSAYAPIDEDTDGIDSKDAETYSSAKEDTRKVC